VEPFYLADGGVRCDLSCGQAADEAQAESDLGLRRQHRVAAHKHQATDA
jgi:hypothetical protein